MKLYATARDQAARGGDDLYTSSLMTLADGLSAGERKRLVKARDNAVKALHDFADWLEAGLARMPDWTPMGEQTYNHLLKRVLLLPFDARDVATLGEIELGRYRALEAMLKDPRARFARSGARAARAEGPGRVPRCVRVPAAGDDRLPASRTSC